ncbi:MAG: trypsin-like peptidase domain-containing protein [Acidobacteriota bacterium]
MRRSCSLPTAFLAAFCLLALGFATAAPADAQKPVTAGEYIFETFQTSHPYVSSGQSEATLTWFDEINFPGAVYIAPFIDKIELAAGDELIIRSPDNKQRWVYTDLGRHDMGGGFYATHIRGDRLIMELWTTGTKNAFGVFVSHYGRGYNEQEILQFWAAGLGEKMNLPLPPALDESLCGADDSEEAKCYQGSEPDAYNTSRAVARLLRNGGSWCTGWLIGSEGHLMTNEHCIGSQSALASIDFEFMAEGPDCATDCSSPLACSGTIEASSGTMIQFDSPLDYALLIPDTSAAGNTDLPGTYGFMRLRESGAVLGERIYIPQHPAGWGKRIGVESSYPDDVDGYAKVNSVTEVACSGAAVPDVGYWADTQGGSSGSPVLGHSDNRVIALHHCRGSAFCTSGNPNTDDPNRGVPVGAIIADLGANLPASAVCDPVAPPTGLSAVANGDNRIDLSWSAPASVSGGPTYNVYRAIGGCPGTDYELISEGQSGTSYIDNDVSGDVEYAYAVSVIDAAEGCESDFTSCSSATTTGACTLDPDFAGLVSATNTGAASCGVDLDWNAATELCGKGVQYNVYRSTDPDFTPSADNLLESCVSGSTYSDSTVAPGIEYFYSVTAEDDSGNGSGVCGGGNEDDNGVVLSAIASGPNQVLFNDDVEGAIWTTGAGGDDTGTNAWEIVTDQSNSPTHSWFVSDEPVVKDQWLELSDPIVLPPGVPAVLEFHHFYNIEPNWDGGVLEVSTDGGTTWVDILDGNPDRFLEGGYTGPLNASSNPLGGRAAWHGNNQSFGRVQVDLTDFAGQSIQLRFRMGCDTSVAATGWWVDDVSVYYGGVCTGSPGLDTVFEDTFSDGTTDSWDEIDTGGGDLVVNNTAYLAGPANFGVEIDQADLDRKRVRKNFSAEDQVRVRFHLDPNSITMDNNKRFKLAQFRSGTDRRLMAVILRYNTTTGFWLRAKSHRDDDSWAQADWVNIADAPQYVEVEWTRSSGPAANDGVLRLWVDGALTQELTGIDNDSEAATGFLLGAVGGLDANSVGSFYVDHVEIRQQSYIGE